MTPSEIVEAAHIAFGADEQVPPRVSLRAGQAIDSYDAPTPFDPAEDAVSSTYLERYAYWALPHLDAASWRHYLPHLMSYALDRQDDPGMVVEGLIQSLRPPDRYPPRLGSLNAAQEQVVRTLLETLALEPAGDAREDARQALQEWWWPSPSARPTAEAIVAMRAQPTTYRRRVEPEYRLVLPDTLVAGGVRDIPSESRRVQTWGGSICGDVPALVAVNAFAPSSMSFDTAVTRAASFFDPEPFQTPVAVRGTRRAVRIDGLTHLNSPAEPQRLIAVIAGDAAIVMLTIRAGIRDDVAGVLDRIALSFELGD